MGLRAHADKVIGGISILIGQTHWYGSKGNENENMEITAQKDLTGKTSWRTAEIRIKHKTGENNQ